MSPNTAPIPAEFATCGGAGGMKLRDDFGRLPTIATAERLLGLPPS
jgi:hypothetical protein